MKRPAPKPAAAARHHGGAEMMPANHGRALLRGADAAGRRRAAAGDSNI